MIRADDSFVPRELRAASEMRVSGVFVVGQRVAVGVLLVCLLSSVLVALGGSTAVDAQSASESASAASSVRITARKLVNGNIEFGLRLAGGEQWVPRARFFPYATVDVGRWLRASPYGMSDGVDVRHQGAQARQRQGGVCSPGRGESPVAARLAILPVQHGLSRSMVVCILVHRRRRDDAVGYECTSFDRDTADGKV